MLCVCIHVCVSICVFIDERNCIYVNALAYICVCMRIYIYACVYVCRVYIRVDLRVCISMDVHVMYL